MKATTPTTTVRWARASDASDIVRLIMALAKYENEPASSVRVTEADILRDGFGEGLAGRFRRRGWWLRQLCPTL